MQSAENSRKQGQTELFSCRSLPTPFEVARRLPGTSICSWNRSLANVQPLCEQSRMPVGELPLRIARPQFQKLRMLRMRRQPVDIRPRFTMGMTATARPWLIPGIGYQARAYRVEFDIMDQGTSKNLAFRPVRCDMISQNPIVPFVLSRSKHERNRFFEVPVTLSRHRSLSTTVPR